MNFDRLNSWLSLIANVGVLLGIFLVAYELRQNSIQVRAQTRSNLAEDTVEHLWHQLEHQGVQNALRKVRDGEPLTADEGWLVGSVAHITLRRWENIYYQYRIGLYDESEFSGQASNWKRLLREEGMIRPYWEGLQSAYSPEFANYISSLIHNE